MDHVLTFVDRETMRPLIVVADTANGMGGLVVPAVMERLPVRLHHLFPDLDGTFPNHPADPIDPENQRDLKAAVLEYGADVGLAFDGDADRVFLIDERAQDVSGSLLTALVAEAMLEREPGAKIVHNLICSWTVPEVIREHGGIPVRTRVGHSFIKQVMAETGAVFGGEHSGHYYFRDNYRADSGLIAAVVAMGELSKAEVPLSALLAPLRRYVASGEINTRVDDQAGRIEAVAGALADGRTGPARRSHGGVRRLVVQRAPVEHRAAAAPERGGPYPRAPGGEDRDGARPDQRGERVSVPAELLEILVCPNDHGDGRVSRGRASDRLHRPAATATRFATDIPVMLIDEAEKPGGSAR